MVTKILTLLILVSNFALNNNVQAAAAAIASAPETEELKARSDIAYQQCLQKCKLKQIEKLKDFFPKGIPEIIAAYFHISYEEWTKNNAKLIRYITTGEESHVRKLLESGMVNPNVKDLEYGIEQTALMLSVGLIFSKIAIVKLLLSNGADINAIDKNDKTALIHAVVNGNMSIIRLLLLNGADVNAKDKNEKTALTYAKHGHPRRDDIVKLLRRHIAKKEFSKAQSGPGTTHALMFAHLLNCGHAALARLTSVYSS